ncbi:hypothetical protein G9U51_01690 [Calidifontibacter sp. DB0510]|uniref:DUF2029 domain-containing protein n=1 Tax=Metallococcus carri TaxID=1656884 RepID=A0A967B2K9_9MICO|nr:polyprenol phosphomannose-dependent alpha 1,6 mannosyltransferase MptB [Metallococcus carri]NHN54492.1 hypothetical protein [Metallococcus carri]NOP36669.1 polyprenol phosphomannose-dependent alpha 1,6 mannosyltransferase MptB [Calidifontibacter sp. DB2511S]
MLAELLFDPRSRIASDAAAQPAYGLRMVRRGLVGSVLVLLGSFLTAVLPASTPLMHFPPVDLLRSHVAGRMLGLVVVLVGLSLLAAAWLGVCRHVRGLAADAGVRFARLAALIWCLPLVIAPPLFSRDGWSYAAQGVLVHRGISPYQNGPAVLDGPIIEAVDPRWMYTPVPYGPIPLSAGNFFASLTERPYLLVIMHRLVALAGLVLLAWALPRLARLAKGDPALATAVVLGCPLVLANGVGGLHNDLLMVGLMAVGLALAAEGRWVWGLVLAGLAAGVKAPGGLVAIPIVLMSLPAGCSMARRVGRLVLGAVISIGALVGVGYATGLGVGWIAALTVPASVTTPLSITSLTGGMLDWFASLLGLQLAPDTLLQAVRDAGTVLALVLVVAIGLRARTGDRADAVRTAALVCGGFVLLSPTVHLWYLMWALPFLAALPLRRPHLVGVLAMALIGGLIAPLDSSLHGAYATIAVGSIVAAIAAYTLLATPGGRDRLLRIAAYPVRERAEQTV